MGRIGAIQRPEAKPARPAKEGAVRAAGIPWGRRPTAFRARRQLLRPDIRY